MDFTEGRVGLGECFTPDGWFMFDSCKDFLHFLRTKELKPKQYKGHKSALQRLIDCKLPEIREFYIVLGSDKERKTFLSFFII